MKNIFIALMMFCAFSGKAQTVLTDSATGYSYIAIAGRTYGDSTATRLVAWQTFDDFKTTAEFKYELRTEASTKLWGGTVHVSGEDYSNWNGNSEEATYQLIANKLNLILP